MFIPNHEETYSTRSPKSIFLNGDVGNPITVRLGSDDIIFSVVVFPRDVVCGGIGWFGMVTENVRQVKWEMDRSEVDGFVGLFDWARAKVGRNFDGTGTAGRFDDVGCSIVDGRSSWNSQCISNN